MAKEAAKDAVAKVRTNLAEYMENGKIKWLSWLGCLMHGRFGKLDV